MSVPTDSYAPAADSGSRRSRTQSDPSQAGPYVTPPYTIQRPAPARDVGTTPHSRSPSVERTRTLAPPHTSSSRSGTSPPSPRSPSPRSGHRRSSSRHASIRVPSPQSGPLINDPPPPPRTALNGPSTHHPHRAGSIRSQNMPEPMPFQGEGVQRRGSHHTAHQQTSATVFRNATHVSHHHSGYPSPVTTHHVVHPRSRSRPPTAASHRYASTITPPVYGHGSSASNASRSSLNGSAFSQRHQHVPVMSISYYPGTPPPHMSSGSPQRSHSYIRASSSASRTTITAPLIHDVMEITPNPPSSLLGPAHRLHRRTHRPPLPANYDGETQTRFVRMLLALEDISPIFNMLAAFFTWILLAGFLLFPGTFASLRNESSEGVVLTVVNHIPLYTIAWICTGVGGCGMVWLWWRWYGNYIWLNNRIFIPGCLNSLAGIISTLSSIYGAQAGVFDKTEKSTIIVTSALAFICGVVALVYTLLLRKLKLEHDRQVGHEKAGKHGEGVLGEKRDMENARGVEIRGAADD